MEKHDALVLFASLAREGTIESKGYGPGGYSQYIVCNGSMEYTLITCGTYDWGNGFVSTAIDDNSIRVLYTPEGKFDLSISEAHGLRERWNERRFHNHGINV